MRPSPTLLHRCYDVLHRNGFVAISVFLVACLLGIFNILLILTYLNLPIVYTGHTFITAAMQLKCIPSQNIHEIKNKNKNKTKLTYTTVL